MGFDRVAITYQMPLSGVKESSSQALQMDSGQRDRPALDTSYNPPATHEEQFLVELWQKTVGIDRIGVDDDFFVLGGDSIIAIQIQFAIFRQYVFRIRRDIDQLPYRRSTSGRDRTKYGELDGK